MSKIRIPHIPHAKAVVATAVSVAVIGTGAMAYAAMGPTPPRPTAALTSARLSASTGTPSRAALRATAGPGVAGPGAAADPGAAAGPNSGAGAGTRAAGRAAPLRQLGKLVIGEVTSLSTSGGAASVGAITIQAPDGKTVTANLAKRTRVFAYHGRGVKPTAEALTDLKTNELVAVRVVTRRAATSSTASGTTTGTPYAALIVDLGFATSAP